MGNLKGEKMLGFYVVIIIIIVSLCTGLASAHLAKNKGYVDEWYNITIY
jgi:hypothetical protein